MFTMMNAMRIEVGLGGEPRQARLPRVALLRAGARAGRRADRGARRREEDALLQKAYSEGAYALCMHAAALARQGVRRRRDAAKLLGLQTEIVNRGRLSGASRRISWRSRCTAARGTCRTIPWSSSTETTV